MANHAVNVEAERSFSVDECGATDMSDTPSTVDQYISGIVLKELWASQLARQTTLPGAASMFDPNAARELVALVSPKLSNDIIDAVRGWMPVAEDLRSWSLLPDLHEFPTTLADEDGVTLGQRKLLQEVLKIVLDAFNEEHCVANLAQGGGPSLTPSSIACISAQLAAMLEHLSLTRSQGAQGLLQQDDIDLNLWQNACAHANAKPKVGSKKELVDEIQDCRRRIFGLEKQLMTQSKADIAILNRERREAEKAHLRLITVNQALEEKLTVRAAECVECNKRICDLERRVTYEQNLVLKRNTRITKLENELERMALMQDDLLLRERKYGERMLSLRVEEFMSIQRDRQRKQRLENAIHGHAQEADPDVDVEQFCEESLNALARVTLKKVQAEFADFIVVREENLMHLAEKCEEQRVTDQNVILQSFEHDNHLPAALRTTIHQSLSRVRPTASVGAQTDPERRPSVCKADATLAFTKTRSSVTGEDMYRKRRASLADVALFSAQRRSCELNTSPKAADATARRRASAEMAMAGLSEDSATVVETPEKKALHCSPQPSKQEPPKQDEQKDKVLPESDDEDEDGWGEDDDEDSHVPLPPVSPTAGFGAYKRASMPVTPTCQTPSTRPSSRAESARASLFSPERPKIPLIVQGFNPPKTARRSVLTFERVA